MPSRPVEEWRANADLLLESLPALAYLIWIHPDGHRYRLAAQNVELTRRDRAG